MSSIYRAFTEKLGDTDASTFVGNEGELFWDPTTTSVKISDGSTAGGVGIDGGSSTTTTWTRFYFDRGGAVPSGSIANSENVGKNFGTWTETISANIATTGVTPTSTTYDPTLTGVTVNANGEFELVAGVYEIAASIQFRIFNSSGILNKFDFYLYGESGSDWAGSYDEQLLVPDTSVLVNNDMMVKMGGLYVFENATQTNNIIYLQMGTGPSPVDANFYPDYGFMDIKKIG